MSIQPIPDDQKITLIWSTTTVLDYTATFTLGELREAVNAEHTRHGGPAHSGISDDLHLLEDAWLGDYEDEGNGALVQFTREVTGAPKIPMPALAVFTVTVEGPERHDGEAPYTYVLHAADGQAARALALTRHIRDYELDIDPLTDEPADPDAAIVEGPEDTFPGVPEWPADTPGRAWNDLRTDAEALTAAHQTTR